MDVQKLAELVVGGLKPLLWLASGFAVKLLHDRVRVAWETVGREHRRLRRAHPQTIRTVSFAGRVFVALVALIARPLLDRLLDEREIDDGRSREEHLEDKVGSWVNSMLQELSDEPRWTRRCAYVRESARGLADQGGDLLELRPNDVPAALLSPAGFLALAYAIGVGVFATTKNPFAGDLANALRLTSESLHFMALGLMNLTLAASFRRNNRALARSVLVIGCGATSWSSGDAVIAHLGSAWSHTYQVGWRGLTVSAVLWILVAAKRTVPYRMCRASAGTFFGIASLLTGIVAANSVVGGRSNPLRYAGLLPTISMLLFALVGAAASAFGHRGVGFRTTPVPATN